MPRAVVRFLPLLVLLSAIAFLTGCNAFGTSPTPTTSQGGTPPTTSYSLTVSFSGTGTGATASNPQGISCRTGSSQGCSSSFTSGTAVTLTVTPDQSMLFAGWQGGGCTGTATTCTITIRANTTVTLALNAPAPPPPPPPPTSYTLTVSFAGTGTGAVASSPQGISCRTGNSQGCSASFTSGTAVTLTVTPDQSMVFAGWQGGGCSGTAMTCTVTVTANTTVTATLNPPTQSTGPINHIIFLAEENRSFDHYFGKLNDYRSAPPFNLPREVNGLPDNCSSSNSDWTVACGAMNMSPNSQGVPTTPIYAFHLKTSCIDGLSPDWTAAHWDFNLENPTSDTPGTEGLPTNAPDGFVVSAASAAIANSEPDTAGIRAMGFYTGDDLPYHYWLATEFATSDTWFNPAPTRTQPNRYYLMGGTSGGYAYPLVGGEPEIQSKTIFDELQAAGISWKIYTQLPSGYTYADAFAGFGSRYANTGNVVTDPGFAQFISDAQSGKLPAVVFLEKPDADEKPESNNDIQSGVNETKQLINAVMYGPSWKDSVIIFTFDEWGGMYDHVTPPTNVPSPDGIKPVDICTSANDSRCAMASLTHSAPPYDPDGDFTRYGFRVPLVVISPFTKSGYVSHITTDTTSWLKFVEERFNLKPLTARDGWSKTSDMSDFFNYQNPPWATPPQNPPTDPTGNCVDTLP